MRRSCVGVQNHTNKRYDICIGNQGKQVLQVAISRSRHRFGLSRPVQPVPTSKAFSNRLVMCGTWRYHEVPQKGPLRIRGQLDPRDEVTTAVEKPRGLHDSMHQAERNGRSMFEASPQRTSSCSRLFNTGFFENRKELRKMLCVVAYPTESNLHRLAHWDSSKDWSARIQTLELAEDK